MATNTLGEFSDGEDDFVFQMDENLWEWSDPEADDLIRNINEEEVLSGVYDNDDDLIRNIDEDEVLAQTGRGEKRKSEDEQDDEQGQYYYHIESRKNITPKNSVCQPPTTRYGSIMYLPILIYSKVTKVP